MNTKNLARVLAATAVIGLALAGCGAQAPAADPAAAGSSSAAQGAQNDADVTFAQGMIVHHRQAVEMAAMAAGRSENPQILDLASRIGAAQQPEIETMTGWLQSWGAQVPAEGSMGGMPGMDMPGMSGMDGTMSPEQMQQLGAATGAAFDRLFLEQMTEHHRGAVTMAQTELEMGSAPEATALAQTIIDTQQGEITEMEALLAQL